jgi:RNA polymerase sigma factor (sigma-70 family)
MLNITAAILRHSDMLAAYAGKLTRDRDDARDLCQDTLFKALANQSKFNDQGNIQSWLCTIMYNLFVNNYRRRKLEQRLFARGTRGLIFAAEPRSDAFATTLMAWKDIQPVIESMPAILRTPIRLYSQGYKYHEIAALTATAVGTTKSRIYMARQLLRRLN